MSKALFESLKERKLLEFGSVIDGDLVREILGLEYPEVGTKKQFDDVALTELGAIDYVRTVLLNEGKYIAGHNGNYRILLPSENKRQVETYMNQADKKLHRAQKLSKNMPVLDSAKPDNVSARIVMKRESIRHRQNSAGLQAA